MDTGEKDKIRLGDRILSALELSLAQDDLKISELLMQALETSMTRNIHGDDFVERRNYPPELERAWDKLQSLRARKGNL